MKSGFLPPPTPTVVTASAAEVLALRAVVTAAIAYLAEDLIARGGDGQSLLNNISIAAQDGIGGASFSAEDIGTGQVEAVRGSATRYVNELLGGIRISAKPSNADRQ